MALLSIRHVQNQSFDFSVVCWSVDATCHMRRRFCFFTYYVVILETFLYVYAWEIITCEPTDECRN